MKQHRNALPEGHKVHWYVIKKVLGQGGFGITYLAADVNLGRDVAIKEYLPTDMAFREDDSSVHPVSGECGDTFSWGLDRFISEAQTLARFKHPNIVHVFSVFRENNTAYMVMEYEHGRALDHILKQRNTLPENELLEILNPLLTGLEQVHAMGFIHRDIKPANIYIREDGSPVLLDFGSARQSLGEHSRTLTAMVSPGYAPFEQYTSKGEKQGPWTDIYGLGASLYRAVTGLSPPNAMDRSEAIHNTSRDIYVGAAEIKPDGYAAALLDAIDRALAFRPEDRPQSIPLWRELMQRDDATIAATQASLETPSSSIAQSDSIVIPRVSTQKSPDRNPIPIWRWLAVVGVLMLFVLVMIARVNGPRRSTEIPLASQAPPAGELVEETIPIDVANVEPPEPEEIQNSASANPEPLAGVSDLPVQEVSNTPAVQTRDAATTDRDTRAISSDRDPAVVETSDARPFESLRRRLQQNPGDQEARKELRTLFTRYEARIKDAMKRKDYEQAENAVREMLKFAPNNEKLNDSLTQIRKLRQAQ